MSNTADKPGLCRRCRKNTVDTDTGDMCSDCTAQVADRERRWIARFIKRA